MAAVLAVRHHDSILGTLIFPSFRIARIDDEYESRRCKGSAPGVVSKEALIRIA